MSTPAIIWIALMALCLGIELRDHGKPKIGKDNFWVTLSAASIQAAILYWGGFFK